MKTLLSQWVTRSLLTVTLGFPGLAWGGTFKSPAAPPAIVELYTSEGCSNCPPAEKWFNHFKKDPELWKKIIPMAFHVDYFDNPPWKDPISSPDHTVRQNQYVRKTKSELSTPQVIVNGVELKNWVESPSILPPSDKPVGILELSRPREGRYRVTFRPSGHPKGAWEAHVALLGMGITAKVGAGDNQGRRLAHEFAVLGHNATRCTPSGKTFEAEIEIPQPDFKAAEYAVVAWISVAGEPTPLQAVGGPLDKLTTQ